MCIFPAMMPCLSGDWPTLYLQQNTNPFFFPQPLPPTILPLGIWLFLTFCLLGPPSCLSLLQLMDSLGCFHLGVLHWFSWWHHWTLLWLTSPVLFSVSWYLSLDVWDWFLFTDGVILVGLFPVSCPANSAVSLFMMAASISSYPLGWLFCVSIRLVAPLFDASVVLWIRKDSEW